MLAALGGSVLLHAAVLFAVSVSQQGHGSPATVIEARLVSSAPVSAGVTPHTTAKSSAKIQVQPASTVVAETTTPALPATVEAQAADLPGTAYVTAAQLDTPPHMLGAVQQSYPARARSAAVEGYVTLNLLINERGEVEDASVVQAQPTGYFEEAAVAMLRKQRFSPPIKQNHAVKSRWLTTVRYRLQG